MSKQSVTMEKTMNIEEVIDYLEELVACFKAGRIVVSKGDKHVILCPAASVDVEVEAKHKKDKKKLSLELSWKCAPILEEEEEAVTITAKEPEMIPPQAQSEDAPAEEHF